MKQIVNFVSFFVKQTRISVSKYAVPTAEKALITVVYRQEKSLYFEINTEIQALSFWQGQKDLNPRHAVLETAALPTELYPYVVAIYCATARFTENGGPSGTRTPDRPVMSRML